MLITPQKLMADAKARKYAVPAFNFYNLDTMLAALDVAEEEKAPIILEIYHVYYPFLREKVIFSAVQQAIRQANTYAYMHLDHAGDPQVLKAAIADGFQSVMVDGSALPIEENIAFCRDLVAEARERGIYTETEVGHVGRVGTEDCHESIATVEDCRKMVEETGCDSLAAAVGTAHGIYKTAPKINFDRIMEIQEAVSVPLVLHGGSGTPDDDIRRAISCGIVKVNVGTELKYAWSETMKKGLDSGEQEPRLLSEKAREAVREVVRQKIRLFGASGKLDGLIKE